MRIEARALLLTVVSLTSFPPLAGSDDWDVSDANASTTNEVLPGSVQDHEFFGANPDPDWYRIATQPHSSYEFVLDNLTPGTVGLPVTLDLVDSAGTVLQASAALPSSAGLVRTLRFQNATASARQDFVRADNGYDFRKYRIHVYETTVSVPRFNNAGGQVTVLIAQNPSSYTVTANVYLWSGAGALVTTVPLTLAPKAAMATNLGSVNGGAAAGMGGTITIAHDARYGDLVAKSVALEPATGFSFDSPGVYRPY